MDLSGVGRYVGVGWVVYYFTIHPGQVADHRIVYHARTNLQPMQGEVGGDYSNRQF